MISDLWSMHNGRCNLINLLRLIFHWILSTSSAHSSFVSGGSSFGTFVRPRFLQSTVPGSWHYGDDIFLWGGGEQERGFWVLNWFLSVISEWLWVSPCREFERERNSHGISSRNPTGKCEGVFCSTWDNKKGPNSESSWLFIIASHGWQKVFSTLDKPARRVLTSATTS